MPYKLHTVQKAHSDSARNTLRDASQRNLPVHLLLLMILVHAGVRGQPRGTVFVCIALAPFISVGSIIQNLRELNCSHTNRNTQRYSSEGVVRVLGVSDRRGRLS